jgi:DNA polymerase
MTAEEKVSLAHFLDTTVDFLRDGYRLPRGEYRFTDDAKKAPGAFSLNETGGPSLSADFPDDRTPDSMEAVAAEIGECTRCPLHSGRTCAVPGEGAERPLVMIIGDSPGAEEDAAGRPFVGEAGRLLDRMLTAVGLSREKNCFIADAVKCRLPDRDPLPEEIAPCASFLIRQIALLKPRTILCVGKAAAQALLGVTAGGFAGNSMGSLRGQFTPYRVNEREIIPLLSTYHPGDILRDESYKRPAWEDLKTLRKRLIQIDEDYARQQGEG